jgi:SnoaL-like protein
MRIGGSAVTVEPVVGKVPLRAAMEARDLDAVVGLFSPNAVFHSPFTEKLRFTGLEEIRVLSEIVLDVFEDLHYTDEVRVGDVGFLVARARIGAQDIEIVDHLRFNDAGLIEDFTVFFRPLPATATALRIIGSRLAQRKSAARGALVSTMARPLVFMARSGDGVGIKLVSAGL